MKSSDQWFPPARLPRHVGIMMDGNGRWAQARGLTRLIGHRYGTQNVRRVLEACARHGIHVVTLYVFSTENWRRPRDEIEGFFELLDEVIDREVANFHARGVQLRHLGSLEGVPEKLARKVREAVELTRHNTAYILGVAFNYGGRAEILHAARRMAAEGISPAQVSEELFNRYLYTDGLPDMDLVIRTGGEMRLSNFFPWQAANAYYYSTPVCWPDFDERALREALAAYMKKMTDER
jgi:undecaprenyl diphosphate synthase